MSASIAFAAGILLGYLANHRFKPAEPPVDKNVIIHHNGGRPDALSDNPLTNDDIDAAIEALNGIRP